MKRSVFPNRWLPYLLVAPQVAITLVFFFWPAFDSLRLSLYRASPFGDRLIYVGLTNFERLFRDDAYLRAALTSFVFSFVVTFVGLALAFAGIIWLFVFHPSYGILPWLLSFATTYQFNWFLKGWVAMSLIIVAAIWKQFGYNLAFYLAGLQAIETSVLEAASVDGAGPIRRFFAITFPLLSPVTFFLFTLNMTFSFFDTFGLIHSVTQGGPGDATSILVYRAWKDGFVALGVAFGKIAISLLSAFAIVYFNFRGKQVVFWMIFVTLMLPVPVRIVSTYNVISVLGWVDTYWGLTVPLMASATGTFLFRQFFQTIPDSLAEAAQLDGAGPMRFMWTILLPLSKANMAALFVILFVYGWNDYLWPLMITNTPDMRTAVIGIETLVPRTSQLPEWNIAMAAAMMVLLPPVAVIVAMQRWFVKGLIETEK